MSSCCGSVCLLVLLGVVLALGSPLPSIPEALVHDHEFLADVLMLKEPEIGSKPLFGSVIRSINTSCQRREDIMLMNATLDVYTRIFSSLLQNHPRHDKATALALLDKASDSERNQVRKALRDLKHKMESLRGDLRQPSRSQEDAMSELMKIRVDDPIDQRKALAEFKQVYQAASVIGSHTRAAAH